MAARRAIKVSGTKELDRVLKELPRKNAQRAVNSALRSAAAVIRREIVQRAPDGANAPHPKYGELKGNIKVTVEKMAGGLRAIVHTGAAFWSRFLEFGTAVRVVRTRRPGKTQNMSDGKTFYGKEVPPMQARPFFRPAFDSKAQEAVDRLAERLGAGIEREAARLAGNPGRGRRCASCARCTPA